MGDNDQVNQDQSQGNQDQNNQASGWIAALPDEFKKNDFVKTFTKPGDFVKTALEIKTERDSLKTKLAGAIPKLTENATQEQKDSYYKAIGRPEKPEEYELPNNGKNSPEMEKWGRALFHTAGLNKDQAKLIGGEWNKFVSTMVEAHNAGIKKEVEAAATSLKTELGDKYDAGIVLAQRLWKKHSDTDFDKVFDRETNQNRSQMIRYLIKMAKFTGEDTSPPGSAARGKDDAGKPGVFNYGALLVKRPS
jgi:hypothetical protein